MQVKLFAPNPPKDTNLNIDSDEMLREDDNLSWSEKNKAAIDDYNRRVDTHGTFGDGRGQF